MVPIGTARLWSGARSKAEPAGPTIGFGSCPRSTTHLLESVFGQELTDMWR